MTVSLTSNPVALLRANASLMDLATPSSEEIDFVSIAGTLAKLARFGGRHEGLAYSVAQHCVMGADALQREGADGVTAALFLLQDAHKAYLGDLSTPTQEAASQRADLRLAGAGRAFRQGLADLKADWDRAIYNAAGLPGPDAWTNRQHHLVETMDNRMTTHEAIALFGPTAARTFPRAKKPLTRGEIAPWGAMKAEEAFITLLGNLIGRERLLDQSHAAAAHAALNGL